MFFHRSSHVSLFIFSLDLFLDPCKNVQCQNHGLCKPDLKRRLGYRCVCRDCPPEIFKVCGNDEKTYQSECVLKRTSCQSRKPLVVLHNGPCSKFRKICLKYIELH